MSTLLLVPTEDIVVFPNMTIHLDTDVGDEERVLLVPQHEGGYARVGTIAQVVEHGRRGTLVTGLHRGVAGAASTDADGSLRVEIEELADETPPRVKTAERESEHRASAAEILERRRADQPISAFLRPVTEPGALADTAGFPTCMTFEDKIKL